jgi:hypothetical protein
MGPPGPCLGQSLLSVFMSRPCGLEHDILVILDIGDNMAYKRRCWGPIPRGSKREKKLYPFQYSPFAPIFCSHIVSLSHNSFFLLCRILAISLERTKEEKNMWKKLVHGEENPRNELEEQCRSHVVNDFCEINIKKYFFRPAK